MNQTISRYSTEHAGPDYDGYVVLLRHEPMFKHDVSFCSHIVGEQFHMQLWDKPTFWAVYVRVRKEALVIETPFSSHPFVRFVDDPIGEAMRMMLGSNPGLCHVDRVVKLDSADGKKFGRYFEYKTMTRNHWPQRASIPEVEES
jgi:hypothetical protein